MMCLCDVCSTYIHDYVILEMDGRRFHVDCLRCHRCKSKLDVEEKCYVTQENIYCKTHYYEIYSACRRCNGCSRPVFPGHWMRQVSTDILYHLTCFCCVGCKRQLSTGEEFGLFHGAVYCLLHYKELLADPQDRSTSASKKRKHKRIRTTFSEQQIEVLHKTFSLEANPDTAELERLSEATDLSKRVIQVWFQNARARHKKFLTATSTINSCAPNSTTDDNICSHFPSLTPS